MKYVIVSEMASTQKMDFRFKTLLEQCGINQEECTFLTFLGDEKPSGSYGKIPSGQMKRVLPMFREELGRCEGTVLILLGTTVFQAVTGLKWNTTKVSGYLVPPSECRKVPIKKNVQIGHYKTTKKGKYKKGDPKFKMMNVPCDPVLPRGCEWIIPGLPIEQTVNVGYKNITQFRSPFKNALRILSGERPVDDDFKFEESIPLGKDWQGLWAAYDLEVPIGSTAIQQASIASEAGCWSFPWSLDAVAAFKEAMSQADLRIAHNQQYDIPILAHHGVDVPEPTMDTMLAAALLEPDLLKGLEAAAPLHLLLRPWKFLSETVGFTDPYYNAKDSFIELHLAKELYRKIVEAGMEDLFFNRVMPSVSVLMDMKQRGIRVDGAFAEKWCGELTSSLNANMIRWVERHPDVQPSSTYQLRDLLYKTWGLEVQRKKGDGISTDELAIRKLMAIEPRHADDLKLLLKIKHDSKLLSTFGKVALGHEFVHPSYLPASRDTVDDKGKGLAATGRLACFNPNLQQQPKSARRLFIPDDDGMCFIELDWSQAELRVAAALSGDKAMQEALKSDLHGYTQKMLGCDRTRAKNVMFGSAYGGGPRKLRDELLKKGFDVPFKECKDAQTGLAKTYPVWWAWREQIKAQALSQQYLRNAFGRLRRFHSNSMANAALNYLPQSTVADMAWSTYVPVHQAVNALGGRLTTVVHDSFLIQVPEKNVEMASITVKNILEQPFDDIAPGFSCPSNIKVGAPGAAWSDLK